MGDKEAVIVKVKEIMANALGIEVDEVDDEMEYQYTSEWTSRAHMQLMTQLEKEFDITLSPYDILDLSSYEKIVEYILKK